MNIPTPNFIQIPNAGLLSTISIVIMIVGICLICLGVLLHFLLNKKGEKVTGAWICIVVGVLLTVNHSVQLLL